MRKHLFPLFAVLIFSFVFSFLPSLVSGSETLQKISLNTRDIFFSIRHLSAPLPSEAANIVIVAIDEESCEKLKARWPWSRHIFAALIDRLREAGADIVGLNVAFNGLEESGEESSLDLARAMKEHGSVVVGATFDQENKLVKPAPTIETAAARIGYLEKIVDPDFSIRRSYLLRPYTLKSYSHSTDNLSSEEGLFESSFPLQMATLRLGVRGPKEMHFDPGTGILGFGVPIRTISLTADGSYTINYAARETDFLKVPAWKVLQKKIAPEKLKGKTVLVGLTSSLFGDAHPTPYGIMPGIGIHANEYLSVVSGRVLRFVPTQAAFLLSWLGAALILTLFLFRRFWLAMFGALFILAMFFFGAQALFAKDLVFEPFILALGPVLAVLTGVTLNSLRLLLENKGLETKVVHDKMTGLYTYDFLRFRLEEEWKRCRRSKIPVTIVMTDLDRFKKINDTLGHEVGNEMIRRASRVIKDSTRGYDIVSRYGGDEFVILLWNSNNEEALTYRDRLRELYHSMAKNLEPALQDSSISIGVATFDPKKDAQYPPSPQVLIELADKDLYHDKESRRKK